MPLNLTNRYVCSVGVLNNHPICIRSVAIVLIVASRSLPPSISNKRGCLDPIRLELERLLFLDPACLEQERLLPLDPVCPSQSTFIELDTFNVS